jgi:hypothetical protein
LDRLGFSGVLKPPLFRPAQSGLYSRPLKTHPKQTKTTHFANHPNQQNLL